MIDFEISQAAKEVQDMAHEIAEDAFRKIARYYDDNEHGIKLSWGPEGGHRLGDMCFTPTAYQQARITNLAYQPREYESLMRRKKQTEEKKLA